MRWEMKTMKMKKKKKNSEETKTLDRVRFMLICMYLCDSMRCDVMINLILGVMSFQAHTDHLHTTYVSIVSNELHSLHTENRL